MLWRCLSDFHLIVKLICITLSTLNTINGYRKKVPCALFSSLKKGPFVWNNFESTTAAVLSH